MKTKKLPAGTTQAQWDAYEIELREHNEKWDAIKPQLVNFATAEQYLAAVSKWAFESLVSMPNEPGYEFANND